MQISAITHLLALQLAFQLLLINVAVVSAQTDDQAAAGDDCPPGAICDSTPYIHKLWVAHGVLMLLGFVIMIPMAIFSSLIRKFLPGDAWFKIHALVNWTAVVMILVGFAIAVYIKQVTHDLPHFAMDTPHRAIGLAIFLLLFVHSIWGYFRPHLPKDKKVDFFKEGEITEKTEFADESGVYDTSIRTLSGAPVTQKTRIRIAWEICHRFFGCVILSLGWYNCYSGLAQFEGDENEALLANGPTAVLVLYGICGGILMILVSAKMSRVL